MADWTSLDTNTLLPGEPLTSAIALALEENPRAIAEGAANAPLISGALVKIIDTEEIGSFIFARRSSTTAYGAVVAGSSLTYAGGLSQASASTDIDNSLRSVSFNAGGGGSPSGSWKCLGEINVSSSATPTGIDTDADAIGATLWQRVA